MAQRSQSVRVQNHWPGFVDAMAALLVVIIFLLVVFVLAQIFLSQALSGRDKALEELNVQIDELTSLLALEKQETKNLRVNIANLSESLQQSNEEKDQLLLQLQRITQDADKLTTRVQELNLQAKTTESELLSAKSQIKINKETIRTNLAEVEMLRRDIQSLRVVRAELENKVATLSLQLETSEKEVETLQKQSAEIDEVLIKTRALVGKLRNRSATLETKLEGEQDRTLLAQKKVRERDVRLAELQRLYLQNQANLKEKNLLSEKNLSRVSMLNAQIAALRAQLEALQGSLEKAEKKDREQKVVISDLGRRLNRALAQKVEELSRYRSEFFGQLRKVLGNRQDVRVDGDRFVFQSEVLFESGSADLGDAGKERLVKLANTLLEIIPSIPPKINWVLRVDGHTDSQPINTPKFPSNWELSTARATNVAKFLVKTGIPPKHLAATGFAQYQPIDLGNDEIAYRRNRRIEFKLTER